MKQEDYVSYDVAKLLKEKGYNHYQKQHYFTENINACKGAITIKGKTLTDMFPLSNDFNDKKIYAPSLWDAAKWLREEYNIAICPVPYSSYWDYTIFDLKNFRDNDGNHKILGSRVAWSSYEEALSEGLKEALKMI